MQYGYGKNATLEERVGLSSRKDLRSQIRDDLEEMWPVLCRKFWAVVEGESALQKRCKCPECGKVSLFDVVFDAKAAIMVGRFMMEYGVGKPSTAEPLPVVSERERLAGLSDEELLELQQRRAAGSVAGSSG